MASYMWLTKVASNFYCNNPPIIARYEVKSLVKCGELCMSTSGCSHFNFGIRNNTGFNPNIYYCDITGESTVNAAPITSLTGINWAFYVIN